MDLLEIKDVWVQRVHNPGEFVCLRSIDGGKNSIQIDIERCHAKVCCQVSVDESFRLRRTLTDAATTLQQQQSNTQRWNTEQSPFGSTNSHPIGAGPIEPEKGG
jgi:hypothetical protein